MRDLLQRNWAIKKLTFSYLFLFVGSALAIYLLSRLGDTWYPLTAPSSSGVSETTAKANLLFATLSSLLVVIIVTRVVGSAAKALGQPRVIGEVIGGIMLGPSLLGTVSPGLAHAILPPDAVPYLSVLSQIGVLLFMFLIGLELDLSTLKKSGRAAVLISHASIILPFILGMGFAFAAYKTMAPANIGFSSFALFIGTALSVTAFPVLARILSDLNQHKTPIGVLALTCAAIDDATAWCLLALIVGILQSAIGGALYTIVLTALYILAMVFIARPLMKKLIPWLEQSSDHISEASLALVLIGLLISAVSTELIGIHALFGGFILGAIIPHESNVAKDLTLRLGDLVRVFF
ncbi:MAG: cation:proton antiporter domain-containing protein, partial [Bdellovibrionales bacterium]